MSNEEHHPQTTISLAGMEFKKKPLHICRIVIDAKDIKAGVDVRLSMSSYRLRDSLDSFPDLVNFRFFIY